MDRITPAEWRTISLALGSRLLEVGDQMHLDRDHDRWGEVQARLREYEALGALIRKVAQRTARPAP